MNIKKLIFVLLSCLLELMNGLDIKFISEGQKALISEAPWFCAICFKGKIHCGSSIISDRWIVSAAHCFKNFRGFPMDHWTAVCGTNDILGKNLKIYNIKRHIFHDKFDKPFYANDIALVELEESIEFKNNLIMPISFIKPNDVTKVKVALIFGFGATKTASWSNKLLKMEVSIIEEVQCQKFNCKPTRDGEILPIYKSNICAANFNGEGDACQGDSGGGLVYKNENEEHFLIGIVSHGEGCGEEGRPTIYTNIIPYFDWISFNTKVRIHNKPVPKIYNYNLKLSDLYYECPY